MKKTLTTLLALSLGAWLQAQDLSVDARRAAERNIDRQPGYIVRTNGTKIEGLIRIAFLDPNPQSGMINTDLTTAVSVFYTEVNSKGKEKTRGNTFRPKHVDYFVVFNEDGSESRYEPVAMNVFANAMGGGVLNLDGRKPYFQQVIYTNGDFVAYFDPSSDRLATHFSVVKKRGDRALLFSELLRNGNATRSFIGDKCPVLQGKIEHRQFSNSEEGLREFIDFFIECQK